MHVCMRVHVCSSVGMHCGCCSRQHTFFALVSHLCLSVFTTLLVASPTHTNSCPCPSVLCAHIVSLSFCALYPYFVPFLYLCFSYLCRTHVLLERQWGQSPAILPTSGPFLRLQRQAKIYHVLRKCGTRNTVQSHCA